MLNLQRGFVPACLTLGVLLSALPALADTPAKPAAQASAAQIIVLQHVIPADVIKMMHWDLASNLPSGVSQVVAVPLQNALLVTATPAGLAQVRELVKLLDIEPRPVQIKFALAHASEADRKASSIGFELYATGASAVQLLDTLAKQGEVTQQFVITTASGDEAAVHSQSGPTDVHTVAVTPRIHAGNFVTLTLHVNDTDGAVNNEISLARTLKSGDTLVYVLPPAAPGGESFLCFATPTIK